MATENVESKGKEVEPEQEKIPDENDPKTKSKWFGRYYNGEWYCHCKDGDRKAMCRTLKRVDRDNYGKAFWICPKGKGKGQCNFFILKIDKENQDMYDAGSPSRKVAKVTRFENPGQTFRDRLTGAREGLPTPDTGKKDANDTPASSPSQPPNETPTRTQLRPAIDLTRDGEDEEERRSALSDVVIELLRDENVRFNDITELLIRDAIDTETKVQDVRIKGLERTIRRLRNKINELKSKSDNLESTVLLLTGSQTVELSD
ncbi:hypothetical protein B0O99DRAFT_234432 [Bisporella sp. PMI_857]|nr:hypothetical protein B0O99DRAFT_234432 [Bisporella sp. PMI_857]